MDAIAAHPLFPAVELLSRSFNSTGKELSILLMKLPATLEKYFDKPRGTDRADLDQYMETMLFALMQHFVELAGLSQLEVLANEKPGLQVASKRRPNHSAQVRKILLAWLEEHKQHPFPTVKEKEILMEKTGLDLKQLDNWFINARRRY